MKNRDIYIDLLRVVAIFGVVLGHSSLSLPNHVQVSPFEEQTMYIVNVSMRWIIAMFVMISGIYHLRPNKRNISFKEEMGVIYKKIIRIVYALLFWGIFYNVFKIVSDYFLAKEPITLHGILEIPGILIFNAGYYHLWFLYMLIGLYLLTPIFRCFTSSCKKEHLEYFIILFFCIGCLPVLNDALRDYFTFEGKNIFFSVPELTGFMGFYIAGYYFANYKIEKSTKTVIYTLALIALLSSIIGTIYNQQPVATLFSFLSPVSMVIAYAMFILVKDLFEHKKFKDRQIEIITRISKDSFGIYLVHVFALQLVFQTFGVIGLLSLHAIIVMPLVAVTTFVISEIGVMMIQKIPVIHKYII